MIEDMEDNGKLSPIVTERLLGGKKLNILFVFISQYYFKVLKTIRLNITHFMIKVPNKRELQQIALNCSSDNVFKIS